jgi:predicted transcriptional regulator
MPARAQFAVLGPRETDVMNLLWNEGPATVREIHSVLGSEGGIAYTTVMTTMSRLAEKGILSREKEGLDYRYTPRYTCQELAMVALSHLIDDVLAGDAVSLRRVLDTHYQAV